MVTPKKPNPKKFVPPVKGERRGGRQKGTPNKKNAYKQALEKVTKAHKERGTNKAKSTDVVTGLEHDAEGFVLGPEYGQTPLEFLTGLMLDRRQPTAFRAAAAKDIAPYVHAKLATVTVKGDAAQPLVTHSMDKADFAKIAKKVAKDI
jgi:hypothetical protein